VRSTGKLLHRAVRLLSSLDAEDESGGGGGEPAVTWNPADKGTDITLSGGDLVSTAVDPDNGEQWVRATLGRAVDTGIWMFEIEVGADTDTVAVGIADAVADMGSYNGLGWQNAVGYYLNSGSSYFDGSVGAAAGDPAAPGDFVQVVWDSDADRMFVYINGAMQGNAPMAEGFAATMYPAWAAYTDGSNLDSTANFGATAFEFPIAGTTSWDENIVTGGDFVEPTAAVTWNPSDKSANITLTAADLTAEATAGGSDQYGVLGTLVRPAGAGIWQFDVVVDAGAAGCYFGVGTEDYAHASSIDNLFAWAYVAFSGAAFHNNVNAGFFATIAVGNKVSVIWDAAAGDIYIGKNGALVNSGNPIWTGVADDLFPLWAGIDAQNSKATANFGAGAAMTLLAGASSWDGSQT
jgi:hypothetical protein